MTDGVYVQQLVLYIEFESGYQTAVRSERFFEVEGGILSSLTRGEFSTLVLPVTVEVDRSGIAITRYAGAMVPAGGDSAEVDPSGAARDDAQVESGHDPAAVPNDSEAGED